MKKMKFVFPIMVIVAVFGTFILNQDDYNEVTIIHKLLITAGACILSGGLAFILLRDDIDKVDPKPTNNTYNKKGNRK